MRAELERKLRNVRLRCGANLLLEQLGRVLIAAGIASALGVAVARVFGLTIPIAAAVWALGGTVVALTALLWFLKVPSRMGVALMMDERLAFHERFSTALALGGGSGRKDAAPGAHDPFAEAAIREAHQAAEGVALKGHFPLRPSRTWAFTGAAWAIAVAVILLLPTMDLLGHIRERRVQEKEAEQLAQARTDVQQATSAVKAAVDQLGDPELAKELIGLDDISGAKPADLRRQAIRKLGSLSEKLKGKQAGAKLAAGRMLEQMLRRLRGTPGGMLRELGRSLGKSDFSRAAAILREMTEKLAGEKLSDEEKAALAKQLRELGQKLRELAGQNRQLEEELEQAGLDPKLAKMSAEKLREALKKAGLSDQRIEELMQKAAACSGASNRLGQLGDAMAAAGGSEEGGMTAEELAELVGQLDEMASIKEDLEMTEATLGAIEAMVDWLGEGELMGGGVSPWEPGYSRELGRGAGGPGRGYGAVPIDDTGPTAMQKTRVKSKSKRGPIVASWYFKGSQVKGESRREFEEVMQVGKDRAADAVSDNQIPRKYEAPLKKYFGEFGQTMESQESGESKEK